MKKILKKFKKMEVYKNLINEENFCKLTENFKLSDEHLVDEDGNDILTLLLLKRFDTSDESYLLRTFTSFMFLNVFEKNDNIIDLLEKSTGISEKSMSYTKTMIKRVKKELNSSEEDFSNRKFLTDGTFGQIFRTENHIFKKSNFADELSNDLFKEMFVSKQIN